MWSEARSGVLGRFNEEKVLSTNKHKLKSERKNDAAGTANPVGQSTC